MGKDSSFISGALAGGALVGLGMAVAAFIRKGRLSDATGRAAGHAAGGSGQRGNTGADISGTGTGSGDYGGYVSPIDRSSFYRAAEAVCDIAGSSGGDEASGREPRRAQILAERITGRPGV